MREVRPFFAIMILQFISVFERYTIGKSIIKSFYDIVWRITTFIRVAICRHHHCPFFIKPRSSLIINLGSVPSHR